MTDNLIDRLLINPVFMGMAGLGAGVVVMLWWIGSDDDDTDDETLNFKNPADERKYLAARLRQLEKEEATSHSVDGMMQEMRDLREEIRKMYVELKIAEAFGDETITDDGDSAVAGSGGSGSSAG